MTDLSPRQRGRLDSLVYARGCLRAYLSLHCESGQDYHLPSLDTPIFRFEKVIPLRRTLRPDRQNLIRGTATPLR